MAGILSKLRVTLLQTVVNKVGTMVGGYVSRIYLRNPCEAADNYRSVISKKAMRTRTSTNNVHASDLERLSL